MAKKLLFILILIIVGFASFNFISRNTQKEADKLPDQNLTNDNSGGMESDLDPLTIESLRQGEYPGSEITIEQELESGSNYSRYIASYKSEGLKIYAFLTIPNGEKPTTGWPVIIFNHGYIPPAEYRTTERYIPYTDGFSRNGYIVFRSDYRGHGNSEGTPEGAYGSNAYTIDILNAVSSMKKYKDSDPNRIGMWGHSLGGFVTLRSMVVNKDIGGPIQLHHGTADSSVPVEFSEKLANQLKAEGKTVELFTYSGDDHNISLSFNNAMQRSIDFFDKYLKD